MSAGGKPPRAVVRLTGRSEQHDAGVGASGQRPHSAAHLEAVHFRHAHIEEDEVGTGVAGDL